MPYRFLILTNFKSLFPCQHNTILCPILGPCYNNFLIGILAFSLLRLHSILHMLVERPFWNTDLIICTQNHHWERPCHTATGLSWPSNKAQVFRGSLTIWPQFSKTTLFYIRFPPHEVPHNTIMVHEPWYIPSCLCYSLCLGLNSTQMVQRKIWPTEIQPR